MTLVVVLAVAGLLALIAAILTGSTWVALVVIVLAAVGIVILVRDWRREKSPPGGVTSDDAPPNNAAKSVEEAPGPVRADMFKPDISADPDGPSSDARAD